MSRKHYIAIAKLFQEALARARTDESNPERVLRELAEDLAVVLKQDNGAFQRSKFLSAYGFDGY